MRGTALCHSLCRETKKGALIDRRSLSIPLRGRALCEAWAEYCLQFLPGTSPIFWQIYFTCRISERQLTERSVVFLAIYHCSVKIIGRSKGKSVIAAAAYRAGERLCDRETGITHDFTRKGGVMYREILLPGHAPKEYADRQTLWESVTRAEKKSNAQLAREVEVHCRQSFPKNYSLQLSGNMHRAILCRGGMCADIAIHDKGNGNPHAHILLTTRPIKADGSWGAKEKKDYARDENGERIPLIDKKTGMQKLGKGNEKLWKRVTVQANNWNDKENVEKWRKSWADICNRHLSMEQRGEMSDRCEYNRIVKQLNHVTKEWYHTMKALHQMIKEKVRDVIGRIYERVAGGTGYSGKTGRDSGAGGKPADGNRTAASGEKGTPHTTPAESGINRISGEIEQRECHALQTESDIAKTDSRIEGLKEQVLGKVRVHDVRWTSALHRPERSGDRNERIRRLQQRRADRQSSETNGGYGAGTGRQEHGTEVYVGPNAGERQADTESFFRQSETEIADTVHEIRALRARGDAAASDRAAREVQRQRHHLSGEREAESGNGKSRETREGNRTKSRNRSCPGR